MNVFDLSADPDLDAVVDSVLCQSDGVFVGDEGAGIGREERRLAAPQVSVFVKQVN